MALFSRIKNWISGEKLYASDLNAEFNNVLNGFTPNKIEGASSSVANMQATTNPGGVGTEVQAANLLEELKQIRYILKEIKGTAQWYGDAPTRDLTDLQTSLTQSDVDGTTTNIVADKIHAIPQVVTRHIDTFTSSGTWTCPTAVNKILIEGCGGGGGGSRSGGNGVLKQSRLLDVTPGTVYNITIGAGGAGAANGSVAGGNGGDTSFSTLATFKGASGGRPTQNYPANCGSLVWNSTNNSYFLYEGGGSGGKGVSVLITKRQDEIGGGTGSDGTTGHCSDGESSGNFAGGTCFNSDYLDNGGGGGASSYGAGGNGGFVSSPSGQAGQGYGAGGGGCKPSVGTGGAGGGGILKIYYVTLSGESL